MRPTTRLAFCALSILGMSLGPLWGQGGLNADAGPDQSGVLVGSAVNLSGAASVGATTYAWSFTQRPTGSLATLVNPASVTPSFVPDRRGAYTVKLTVGNGSTTAFDTVVITTANRPPVANAGLDVSGAVGDAVTLSGEGSSDPDLDKVTYRWTVLSAPPASVGILTKDTKVKAFLRLDRPGSYVIQLVVKDGQLSSAPDQVTVTTSNSDPVAKAGPDRQVSTGSVVQLDGTASSDIDEDSLAYAWTLKRPSGSSAVLDDPTSPLPSFVPDRSGTFTATLTVNDGTGTAKDSVILATASNRPPVAQAGPDQRMLDVGDAVKFDATGSTDANGQLLSYAWTVTKRPGGSIASLAGPNTPRPTFTADTKGKYTFNFVVTDPGGLTASDTRLFVASLPLANAGPDQVVALGGTAILDGSASSHFDGTLAYGWALISTPGGSTAALDDPADPQPRFVADLAGIYVAQLIVFDGVHLSPADTVVVSTGANLAPRADLGPDRVVATGVPVLVDATATDPNADPLSFSWALSSRPVGSAASLSALIGTPIQLTADLPGDYVVQMIATDPGGLMSVDTLVLTTGSTTPTVDVGPDRTAAVDVAVALDADASDADGGGLTYDWRILSAPAGNHASLVNPTTATPGLTPDVEGPYVVQVVVRDALNLFAIDTVVVRAKDGGLPPVADAGDPQEVLTGTVVQLDGTGSSDPEGAALTYTWHTVSKPVGSTAVLSSESAAQPTVSIDLPGDYVFEVVVNDGVLGSAPDQVTITATVPITLSLTPTAVSVASSGTTLLTVTASSPVAGALVVQLTSSNPSLLTVPASVTIPAGQSSAPPVNAVASAGAGGVIVTASTASTGSAKAIVAVGSRLVQWTDDASGVWSDASKWTDDVAPGIGDVVVIDRPAGSFVITVDATTAAIASLHATEQLSLPGNLVLAGAGAIDGGLALSGRLSGAGTALLDSAMTWNGDATVSLGGGLEIKAGRALTFSGGGFLGGPLRNFGTVAMDQNSIIRLQGPAGSIINEAGGLWTSADGVIASSGPGSFSFTNYGTLRKATGALRLVLQGAIAYVNAAAGKIEVLTGSMQVGGDGDPSTLVNSAPIHVAPGASFNLQYVTLADGTTFTGGGSLTMPLVTTVTGNITIPLPTDLTGTLTGPGTVHMAAAMTWRNGAPVSLGGGLEINAGAVLTFPDGVGAFLRGPLRNFGTVASGQNSILLLGGPSGSVINEAGALWTSADGVIASSGPGSFSFTNYGTLRKSTGALRWVLQGAIAYVNTAAGKIEVLTGNMQVGGDGDPSTLANSAPIHVAPGASFNLQYVTLANGTTFTGGGSLTMPVVTTVTGNITITLPTILTGTLTGPGTLHMAAPMTWQAAATLSLVGGLEVLSGKKLTLPNGGGGRTLSGSSIHNHGTVEMNSSNVISLTGGAAAIVNESDGLWTLTAGGSFINPSGPPVPGGYSFANAGTLQGPGVPTTTLTIGSGVTYSNAGTVSGVNVVIEP